MFFWSAVVFSVRAAMDSCRVLTAICGEVIVMERSRGLRSMVNSSAMNDSGVSVQLCVMLCIALLATSVSAVQISQVVYLPEGSDAGGEAVELYNEQDAPMDIGGWSLRTETSAKDAVVPAGTVLDGRGRF